MADHEAFHHFRTCADETMILDDGRARLQRFQHATDAHAARQMTALADLRAASHRGPRIHHRAFAHEGADVDETRHQHHVLADVAAGAHHGARHHTHTRSTEGGLIEAGKARRHFVPERGGHGIHQRHVLGTEIQQHRFFQPLVDLPAAIPVGLGHPQRALLQSGNRLIHCRAHAAGDLVSLQVSAALPRIFQGVTQAVDVGRTHAMSPSRTASKAMRSASQRSGERG